MKPWQHVLFGTFLGMAASAVIMLVISPPRGEPIVLPPAATPAMLVVYVSGAVNSPGVYSLARDARVINAIESAGGLTPDADPQSINLAARVNDGDRIAVLSLSQQSTRTVQLQTAAAASPRGSSAIPTPTPSYPININTASLQEIEALPSIGSTKAASIFAYRQQHGPFKSLEELQNVDGIGPTIIEKIKNFIKLVD
jgi:competence protein ComEA